MTQGLGGVEGNLSLGKKGVSVIRRPAYEQSIVLPYLGLKRLFLVLVVSWVIFKKCFLE